MGIENSVRLIGNLGNDPDTKYTQGGTAVTKISLATTSKRKDKEGNQVEETQWHRVVMFGKLGEIAGEYLRKGSTVAVEGSIRYGKFDKDGVTHYTTDIIADQMKMLGGRQSEGERPQRREQTSNQPQQAPLDEFQDDDIPFDSGDAP